MYIGKIASLYWMFYKFPYKIYITLMTPYRTYFVVASRVVRPAQLYRVSVTVLKEEQPITVRASIQRNGVEMSADNKKVKIGIPETLLMRVPSTSALGEYKLRVEGLYDDVLGGAAFINETDLIFSQRSMTIFIQLDKPMYMQGETVHFRMLPINFELKSFNDAVDVFMLDPNGHIMKRWLSRQSNLGTVSLDYKLSDQPMFGEWKIRVVAQGQVEESVFIVNEYYQTRFENYYWESKQPKNLGLPDFGLIIWVNVTMPSFFFNTDEYIHGIVMANYTSGAPVRGNLTLKATVRPIQPIDPNHLIYKKRLRPTDVQNKYYNPNTPQDNEKSYGDYSTVGRYNILERYFNFDERLPFWYKVPENTYDPVPTMKFFNGVYQFRYPIRELLSNIPTLDGMEVIVTATVGERFLDEVIEGFSTARIFNSTIKLKFLGDSPQVFKPGMPTTAYLLHIMMAPQYPQKFSEAVFLRFQHQLKCKVRGRKDIPPQQMYQMDESPGVWEYKIDMKQALGVAGPKAYKELSKIRSLRIHATYKDGYSGQLS
ncbi:hypothetical protein NQ317_003730 [Molorchus minor]|uniref:CD109 antigen n=1 Tax=Molorchus minor TaxID=1323400 RepID=A0ABQ9IV09_9CUCU|nr:hypothetical protein NQ317_003730 [Molorchus minor]